MIRLAEKIKSSIPEGLRVLIIDGYQGVKWNEFYSNINSALNEIVSTVLNGSQF
jgi:hypothetical protein